MAKGELSTKIATFPSYKAEATTSGLSVLLVVGKRDHLSSSIKCSIYPLPSIASISIFLIYYIYYLKHPYLQYLLYTQWPYLF